MGSMGRSQMYSTFIMLKHFNLREKKCHFTLYALINRAFPPPAISQFCLQAHPIPTLPMSLQLQEVFFFFILFHSLRQHKIFFFFLPEFASCVFLIYMTFVPSQFLALGTHFGKVFLLDIQGNVTQKFEIVSMLKSFQIIMKNFIIIQCVTTK